MALTDIWNTIKGVLDPGELLLTQDQEAPKLPGYQTALGETSAANAQQLSSIINSGMLPSTGQIGSTKTAVGPNGGQSVPQLLAGAVNNPNAQLNPNYNPHLNAANGWNTMALNGRLGEAAGSGTANAGQVAAMAGGGRIAGAGAPNAGLQTGQVFQTAADNNIIRNSALGTGPSAAEQLAKSQLDQSIRSQASQAATARGGNIASAMRTAAQQGSQMQLQGAQQMAAQRAQEQLSAQGFLTQANAGLGAQVGNARGQDIGQATAAASATSDAAKIGTANYGIGANLASQGLQGLQSAATTYGNQAANADNAASRDRQQYADWLQRQYSIASGIPASYAGPQTQLAIANQQVQQQQQAAKTSAIGGILGAFF